MWVRVYRGQKEDFRIQLLSRREGGWNEPMPVLGCSAEKDACSGPPREQELWGKKEGAWILELEKPEFKTGHHNECWEFGRVVRTFYTSISTSIK